MPGPLGPLPSMSSSASRSTGRRSAAAFNDVDEAALDGLLGSDTEDVNERLSRTRPRSGKATRPPAAGLTAAKKPPDEEKTAGDDWDNDDSDDDSGARSGKLRPPPSRQRAPPKRESAASSSTTISVSVSGADDMDAQLFGLSSSSSTGSQLSRTQPVGDGALSQVRQRSRSLMGNGDEQQQAEEKESRRAALRRAMEQPTPADTPQQPHKPRLTVDKLHESWEEQKDSAAADGQHGAEEGRDAASRQDDRRGSLLGDGVTDRRARYREMMKKKREERQGSITADPGASDGPAAAAAPARTQTEAATSASQPSSSARARASAASASAPSDDPWSSLDDPMQSIADTTSASSQVLQSIAAMRGDKEEDRPFAHTQPVGSAASSKPAAGEEGGSGRQRRPMAGRRAALAASSTVAIEAERPTTAPLSSPPTAAAAASTASALQPPAVNAAAAAATPTFSTWCQWLLIDASASSSDAALHPIARKASTMPLPSHFSYADGVYTDSRSGTRRTTHPGLARWKLKVEQRRLTLRFHVTADSEEDDDTFWKESEEDRQQEEQTQAAAPPPVSSSPAVAAGIAPPSLSPQSRVAAPSSQLPTLTLSPFPSSAAQAVVPPPSAASIAALSSSSSSPQQAAAVAQLETLLASQTAHLSSLRSMQSQQVEDALAHAARLHAQELQLERDSWQARLRQVEQMRATEAAALREQLYDSRLMRGLSERLDSNVRSMEELRGRVGEDTRARQEEREQGWRMREELLQHRERQCEEDKVRTEEQRVALAAQSASLSQQQEQLKTEQAALASSSSSQQQRLLVSQHQLQQERELLMKEKAVYLQEKESWERQRAVERDAVDGSRQWTEREKRRVQDEVEEARLQRADVMMSLDAEREELRLQREMLTLRRRRLDEEEEALRRTQAETEGRERELQQKAALVTRLALQTNQQSQQLLQEKRNMERQAAAPARRQRQQPRPAWRREEEREEEREEQPQYRGEERGEMSAAYRPTLLFAPFLVGLERKAGSRVTAADLKLAEVETDLLLSRRRDSRALSVGDVASSPRLEEEEPAMRDDSSQS